MAEPVTVKLLTEVQLTKKTGEPIGEPITELSLKPTAKAFRDFKLSMRPDGGFDFAPYDLATIGVKLAGHPVPVVVDLLDPADMMELATVVLGFFGSALPTGSGLSR